MEQDLDLDLRGVSVVEADEVVEGLSDLPHHTHTRRQAAGHKPSGWSVWAPHPTRAHREERDVSVSVVLHHIAREAAVAGNRHLARSWLGQVDHSRF